MNEAKAFKISITSEHRLFDLHLKETFQYRDLIFLFVKRDFTAFYKQTILGPLWAVIQPLLTTVVFTVIFGNLAKLTTADVPGDFIIPSFLFYMAGNICWSYFSTTLQATSNTFLNNRNIMGKVYYPRLVSPIATSLSNLIAFGIQLFLLLAIWAYYLIKGGTSIQVTPMLALLPLLAIQMMIVAVGFGIIISSVTTKYRDLAMLVGFGLQLWHYACPVAYGLQLVPENWMAVYMLNPVTPIITTFRYAVFGFGYFDLVYYLISWAISLLVFFFGLILFSRIERTFLDTI
ncbi:MAG: ABC transporter permease [Lachnospiraceae bacterium]|jgi:lipopolysaccharide transport system permease protein|nr:ABC transporter permease [Lachnospiraceae bacterium]